MSRWSMSLLLAGMVLMALSLLMSTGLFSDPRLPIPLAICGSGLVIGGAVLHPGRK